jgi:hypothetical protein
MRARSELSTEVDSRRASGLTVLILGFFAMAWFSWGEAAASSALSTALTVGSAAALGVTILGAAAICRGPRVDGVLPDGAPRRQYAIVVGIEFASAALGAGALAAIGAADYISVWVCAVVGLHFFALAPVLGAPRLRWLGVAVTTVSAAALLVGAFTGVAPSSVAGSGAGVALLAYAVLVYRWPERTMP